IAAGAAVDALLGGGTIDSDRLRTRVAEGVGAASAARPDDLRANLAIGNAIAAARHLIVVGSGADRVSARELTLKFQEAAWVPSAMRDLETFLHGHLPATGTDTALVLILLEREAPDARIRRARQALAAA